MATYLRPASTRKQKTVLRIIAAFSFLGLGFMYLALLAASPIAAAAYYLFSLL
ncbi:MAG TPA: hypothetical protein VFI76_10090 [Terrimicrobiaceae bacterium]|nr:hypothetical protein [Terrimicrobiaceae bacterium]